ncbi:MAG: transposase, partial [Nitrospirae bacterium]|nr:transposase [Fimbriimonadaceae bacterium]
MSKDSLVVSWGTRTVVVKNRAREVKAFFRGVPGDSVVGIEATSTYHLLAADHACGLGLTVYVLNPVDAARYRLAFRSRGKTDAIDAELLARMVLKERDQLRPYRPVPPLQRRLKNLLSRRDKMTKARVMLEQSVGGDASLGKLVGQTLKSFAKAVEQMDRQIEELSREIEGFAELSSVPSLGALNVGGLLCALSVGGFRSADAFVAYVGLD